MKQNVIVSNIGSGEQMDQISLSWLWHELNEKEDFWVLESLRSIGFKLCHLVNPDTSQVKYNLKSAHAKGCQG